MTTTPTRNPAIYLAAGAAAFIGLLIVIVVASGPTAPAPTTIMGTFTLQADYALVYPTSCGGTGPYQDIDNGTPVSILDQAGRVTATDGLTYSFADLKGTCLFTFKVEGATNAYSIRVGNHPPERIYDPTSEIHLESHYS